MSLATRWNWKHEELGWGRPHVLDEELKELNREPVVDLPAPGNHPIMARHFLG